jgi:hypothetical protein
MPKKALTAAPLFPFGGSRGSRVQSHIYTFFNFEFTGINSS